MATILRQGNAHIHVFFRMFMRLHPSLLPQSSTYTRMSTSVEYKTTLACFDRLVTALKSDPVTVSNELASENLIPPLDGPVSAQKLAQLLLCKIEVTSKHYYDVIDVFSRHDWLKDIVETLQSESNNYRFLCIDLILCLNQSWQVAK